MKKIILAFLERIGLIACNQTQTNTDVQKENLTSKVKSVRTIEIEYEVSVEYGGRINKGKIKNLVIYNEHGDIIERNTYHYGHLNEKHIFKYNDKGNRIESNFYKSNGRLDWKTTHRYDDKGNRIEWNIYNSDGSLYKKYTSEYEYDKQGDWIKRIDYGDNNTPSTITERKIEYY